MEIVLIVLFVIVALAFLLNSKKTTESQLRVESQLHDQLHPVIPADVEQLARDGDRIGALRAYRQHTGCTLEIAMARIDAIKRA